MKDSKELAMKARLEALKMVHNSNSSHIGSALSIIDIVSVLYYDILNVNPSNYNDKNRDRFVLSKGHACSGIYSVLALLDFFPKEDLELYGKNNSVFMTHISHKVQGVEFSTGSLGHGLPFGVGKAVYAKKQNLDYKTFVLLSDGEMQEGSNWEAFLFASHHKLNNLVAIIDYNNLQSLTTVDGTLSLQPLKEKLVSFGWNVYTLDGHRHNLIRKTLHRALNEKDKPVAIIAETIKGKGVSFMENKVEWHYKSPTEEELKLAIEEIMNA